eukprot:TRINITY_DN2492_c0_g3_i1.p1 TRINITY_DN2492_c0_g3~~TRINITY_DN2492_c0_g3_i1.p1  ORF type:complete len:373 (+),score=32.54 TRINITY_DN2492_c0_g3_i1:33-1121(+)
MTYVFFVFLLLNLACAYRTGAKHKLTLVSPGKYKVDSKVASDHEESSEDDTSKEESLAKELATISDSNGLYQSRSWKFLDKYGNAQVKGLYPVQVMGRGPFNQGAFNLVRQPVLHPFAGSSSHHSLVIETVDYRGRQDSLFFVLETLGLRANPVVPSPSATKKSREYRQFVRDNTVLKITKNTYRILGPFASKTALTKFYRRGLKLTAFFRSYCIDPDYRQVLGTDSVQGNVLSKVVGERLVTISDVAKAIAFVSSKFPVFATAEKLNPLAAFIASRCPNGQPADAHWESHWFCKTVYNCHTQLAVILDCLKHQCDQGYLRQVLDDAKLLMQSPAFSQPPPQDEFFDEVWDIAANKTSIIKE